MPAHINAFIDLTSPYSYFASSHLHSLRRTLQSHNITLSIHPVFLGAIQVSTGNIPPFKIPAKARYTSHDVPRAAAHFGIAWRRGTPDWFPMKSLAVQRVLTVLKGEVADEEFEKVLLELYAKVWGEWRDLGDGVVLVEVLGELLGKVEAERIVARSKEGEIKQKLTEVTEWAMELGAFGAPFLSVTDSNGRTESFFGSDRFEYLFEFLGVPLQKMRILEKGEEGKAKL